MEDELHDRCNVVYYTCAATTQGQVAALYHRQSPPKEASEPEDAASEFEVIYRNVRTLVDEDLGGFNELFLSNSVDQCWERVQLFAKDHPTAVLIESPESSTGDSEDDNRTASTSFLESLVSDIQGARYMRHVMPFIVQVSSSRDCDLQDSNERYISAGAVETLQSPITTIDIGRLVGHVREQIRPPARLVGANMTQNLTDSIRNTSAPDEPQHRPDQTISAERLDFVQDAISRWHFPAHELDMDELTCAMLFMVENQLKSPELEQYLIPRAKLMGLLLATRRQYKHEKEVHYHNWRHAVDVTQSIYTFLTLIGLCESPKPVEHAPHETTPLEKLFTPLDGLILLVSAIGHDVGHPGVNNAFLVASNHPLAHMYNDKSVLENYHCAAYSQLLRRHWPSLSSIPNFRATMISNILATDMQRHFEYMSSLNDLRQKVADSHGSLDDWKDKDKEHARELIMAILIKAADISNVARPFDVSATWAKILMNEFARQGELEAELQIPTCLFGGPPNKEDVLAAAQSQKGFMNLFGFPLFQGISEIMPSVSCSIRELELNQATWEQKIQSEKARRESEGRSAPLTFSSVGKEEVEQAENMHHRSDPAVVPDKLAQRPSTPVTRQPVMPGDGASAHPAHEEKKRFAAGYTMYDDSHRSSAPFLGAQGGTISPNSPSRRSSKDAALEHLQHLSMFTHQSLNPDSRRGSGDANIHVNQSFPVSRRGSKDESLTTILVTAQGSPGRRSPGDNPSKTERPSGSPGRAPVPQSKRQSMSHTQKHTHVRSSVPSSRSHATSSATAATTATGTQHSPSTQPSSLAPTEDETSATGHHRASVAATEDPFLMPGNWPNDLDGAHRLSVPEAQLPKPPVPPIPESKSPSGRSDSSPRILSRMASGESEDTARNSPRKSEPGRLRESRSRSRLRGLKFWKKKRDVSGLEHGGEQE